MQRVLFVAVICVLLGTGVSFGDNHAKEGKDFVDQSVVAITSNWDYQEYIARATQGAIEASTKGEIESLFMKFRKKFGPIKTYHGSQGKHYTNRLGPDTIFEMGNYKASVDYEYSYATIRMLVTMEEGEWKISIFQVNAE